MPTVSAGSSVTVYCPLASDITVTPGTSGRVSIQARSQNGGQSFAPREMYTSGTISVQAGDTLSIEAINVDATYTAPAGVDTALQALVLGAGISAPSALFANLPAAVDNTGNVIRVTDIGKGGTLWQSDGARWAPVNGRAQLLHTSIPFILSASGSMGNNGAVTLGVALDRVYPRCYMYFLANAIFAGSLAGWFWTVMSSTTVGVVYNNTHTSGYPTIPTVAGFTTTGPGAYTQTAGVDLAALAVTLPGNSLDRWGGLQTRLCMTSGGAGGVKTGKVFAGVSQFHVTTIAAANNFANALGGFNMDGNTNTLKVTHPEQTSGVANGVTYAQIIFTNDMTVDKSVTVTMKTAAAATDWVVLQEAELVVIGG
jgi:hypothetical protein